MPIAQPNILLKLNHVNLSANIIFLYIECDLSYLPSNIDVHDVVTNKSRIMRCAANKTAVVFFVVKHNARLHNVGLH